MSAEAFRAWWGPARLQKRNVDYSDLDRKAARFESRVNFLFRAVFAEVPGSRITYDPPYRKSSYNPLADQLCYSLSRIVLPEPEQDLSILHEFRHRIVSRGWATMFRDFSSLRAYVPEQREAELRARITASVPKEKQAQELDACVVASAAQQLLDVTGDARLAKAILFRSPQ
jgi:hypothetical protein